MQTFLISLGSGFTLLVLYVLAWLINNPWMVGF